MGRTIPSFRLALAGEESDWTEYRSELGKSRRRLLDEVFSITRLYVSAGSAALQPVVIHTVFMSNLFHDFLTLVSCVEQVEKITGARFNESFAK